MIRRIHWRLLKAFTFRFVIWNDISQCMQMVCWHCGTRDLFPNVVVLRPQWLATQNWRKQSTTKIQQLMHLNALPVWDHCRVVFWNPRIHQVSERSSRFWWWLLLHHLQCCYFRGRWTATRFCASNSRFPICTWLRLDRQHSSIQRSILRSQHHFDNDIVPLHDKLWSWAYTSLHSRSECR